MKFSRLVQPRNPLFWLMIVINALSFILAIIAQTHRLHPKGTLIVYGFAACNAVLGIFLAWVLATGKTGKD